MRIIPVILFFLSGTPAVVFADEPIPPVILPRFVVSASPDVTFFGLTWKCNGPFQIFKIKRAWFSEVLVGGAADRAGVKVGDELIRLGGVPIATMTGVELKDNLRHPRKFGMREEIVFRSAHGETRTVEFAYDRPQKSTPATAPAPATTEAHQP